MKLIKILVDEMPNNCRECEFCNRYYCALKGISVGQQFVDRHSDKRDEQCPLTVEK